MLDLVLPERCAICETAGPAAVRSLSNDAHQAHASGLRALRLSGPVAGPTMRRVRGEEARVRACPVRDRLRRPGAEVRALVEGTRPPAPRARCGGARRRGRPEAGGRTRSSRCRAIRSARCAGATSRPVRSRSSSGGSGRSRPSTCSSGATRFRVSAGWRSRSAAGTSAAASSRPERFPRRSASSTTSTPPARRRTPARAPADGSELGTFG